VVEVEERAVGRHNRRFAVALADGAVVEAVLYRGDSLCVSSQVGCAVGCPFCASGRGGLGRPLSLAELVGQVEAVEARGHSLARVTVSGIGEPLHNHHAVSAFVRWCRARRLSPSVTTSGGPLSRLREWLALPHNGLTVSVHAGTEPVRAHLVPRAPALGPLFDTLRAGVPTLSRSRRRKVALAYLVLAGENDGDDEVDAFVDRARPLSLAVHLYDYNPVRGGAHRGVGRARYEAVYHRMRAAGFTVRMSSRARLESEGGCGTLVPVRPRAEPRLSPH
jgi:23S rRNA (adenine2503-C2)-methyltransferase